MVGVDDVQAMNWVDRGQKLNIEPNEQHAGSCIGVSRMSSVQLTGGALTLWIQLRGSAWLHAREGRFRLHRGNWMSCLTVTRGRACRPTVMGSASAWPCVERTWTSSRKTPAGSIPAWARCGVVIYRSRCACGGNWACTCSTPHRALCGATATAAPHSRAPATGARGAGSTLPGTVTASQTPCARPSVPGPSAVARQRRPGGPGVRAGGAVQSVLLVFLQGIPRPVR